MWRERLCCVSKSQERFNGSCDGRGPTVAWRCGPFYFHNNHFPAVSTTLHMEDPTSHRTQE
jgi:hypothetical protein